jgi:competence protein ComEC
MRLFLATIAVFLLVASSGRSAGRVLHIYFVDVEGGQSTLVVTPAGRSLLIDAGYPGLAGRDPDRIMAAARDAGLSRIDYLLITHFHEDHDGGAAELAGRIPIGTFVDAGSPVESAPEVVAAFAAYEQVRRHGKHIVPRPGDRLPLEEIEVDVVSGDGATLTTPLEGAGEPNAACAAYEPRGESRSENRRSLGVRVRFGSFRFFDLGDLVWNRLGDLVCPNNMLGAADAYLATHHANGDANVPAVLAALRPRVTIANNGPYKGGNRTVLASLRELPDTEDVWQLHRSASQEGDTAYDAYIANLEADDHDQAWWIRLDAREDGSFAVTNGRTGWTKAYEGTHKTR